ANSGVSFEDIATGSGWTTRPFLNDDRARIIDAISASPNAAYFVGLLDTNGDGTISNEEVSAYEFTSTAGNPNGQVNAYRALRTVDAPYEVKSKGKAIYLQDTWTLDKLTVNAGLRAEEWSHFGS